MICGLHGTARCLEFPSRLAPRGGFGLTDPVLSLAPAGPVLPARLGLLRAVFFEIPVFLGPHRGPTPVIGAAVFFEVACRRFSPRPVVFAHGRDGQKMKAEHGGEQEKACFFG